MLARRRITPGSRRDLCRTASASASALGRALALAACGSGVAACVGNIGDPGASGGPGGPGDPDDPGYVASSTSLFACKPNLVPPELPLRRLSRAQYGNAVRDLVGALVPAEQDAVLAEVAGALDDVPADAPTGPDLAFGAMRRLDQTIYHQTVEGAYAVGRAVGQAIVASSERLGAAAGSCATDGDAGNDAACVDEFIRGFGARALRRPVTDEDVALYRGVVDGPLEDGDWVDVVTQLFSSPWLLYFVEVGEGDLTEAPVALGAHEMASRLSFHFWQTVPDAELVAAADSGALLEDDGYRAQVERLFHDPRTRSALDELSHDWLAPQYLPQLSAQVGTPAYDAFRGDLTPSPQLRADMFRELEDMVAYYAQDSDTGFDDFFTSDRSFAGSEELAGIYGVPVWEAGDPPAFLEPERVGLLGRAALTATGIATTRPIIKGVYARKALLCDTLPPPPADAMMVAAETEQLNPGATARQRAQAISEARADCAGCHEKLINPLGFVTESFDGLGRFRTVETVYDLSDGAVLGEVPVDSSAVPAVLPDDDRVASDSGTLSRYMLESEKPQACFARHYFRFTFGRLEQDEEDGCTLEAMHAALLEGESMGSVLRAIALRPEFRRRTVEQ